ncbi:MAG: XkdQ/YqbQ family protein [Fusobacteriaceae bacterium]|uniref:XkdQ/YqbQ family protein n=1 Tax=Romboutsia sp. TaxID=1965302 RepID=UPI003F3AB4EF
MHKLKLIQEDKITDITNMVGNINFNTSVDALGAMFEFSIPRSFKDKNYKLTEIIKTGDIIKFENTKNLFTGMIIDIDTLKFSKEIKCFDFYFYLNKNKLIKQFKNLNASACIENLLKSVGAKVGTITSIATSIDKIYKNNTVAEIIDDILKIVNEETGKKYLLEIEDTTFSLVPYKKIKVQVTKNIFGMPTLTESITDMKNIVLVVSNDSEDESIYAKAEDKNSVKKYGMLQEIIEVDPNKDDISKVRNIANTKLKELNKVLTTSSLSVLGNDELKAGRLLDVEIKEFGIKEEFLIKSCTHTFPKGNHICSLELEVD